MPTIPCTIGPVSSLSLARTSRPHFAPSIDDIHARRWPYLRNLALVTGLYEYHDPNEEGEHDCFRN
jgi:hypothetical protein